MTDLWVKIRKAIEDTNGYKPSKNRAIRWCRDMAQVQLALPVFSNVEVKTIQEDVSITFTSGNREAAIVFDTQSLPATLLTIKKTATNWNGDIVDLPKNKESLDVVWRFVSGT